MSQSPIDAFCGALAGWVASLVLLGACDEIKRGLNGEFCRLRGDNTIL